MTFLGIGTLELIVILLIMILIFGPDRITELGRWLGQTYKTLTGMTSEVNKQVMDVRKAMDSTVDLDSLYKPFKDVTGEIGGIKKDLTDAVSVGTIGLEDVPRRETQGAKAQDASTTGKGEEE